MNIYIEDNRGIESFSKNLVEFSRSYDAMTDNKHVRVIFSDGEDLDPEKWRKVGLWLKRLNGLEGEITTPVKPELFSHHLSKYKNSKIVTLKDFFEWLVKDLSEGLRKMYGPDVKGVIYERSSIVVKRPRECYDMILEFNWKSKRK